MRKSDVEDLVHQLRQYMVNTILVRLGEIHTILEGAESQIEDGETGSVEMLENWILSISPKMKEIHQHLGCLKMLDNNFDDERLNRMEKKDGRQ